MKGERPGESMIPFPILGKSFPKIMYKQAAHSTFSHRLPFQISGLHEKTQRGKAKIKTKGNKTPSRKTTPPKPLFTMQGMRSKAYSTVSPLNNGRKSSTQSLSRNFYSEAS